jgi:hypothetical protein
MYGFFSEEFVHIGRLHRRLNPIVPHDERHEALNANIGWLKQAVWLVYVTTELVFFDEVPSPRYWRRVSPGVYAYDPSPKEKRWHSTFLGFSTHEPTEQADPVRAPSLGVGTFSDRSVAHSRDTRQAGVERKDAHGEMRKPAIVSVDPLVHVALMVEPGRK